MPLKKPKYLPKFKLKNLMKALKPKSKNSVDTLKHKKYKLKYLANAPSLRFSSKSKLKNPINAPNINGDSEDKAKTKFEGEFKPAN